MKLELQKQLVEKYPEIFKEYGGDPTVTCMTCMAWGIDVGDGKLNENGWLSVLCAGCRDQRRG